MKPLLTPAVTLPKHAICLIVVAVLGLSPVSQAGNVKQITTPSTTEVEALNSAAATALAMETYWQVQNARIEADFQRRVHLSSHLGDSDLAADFVRLAARRRDVKQQKLNDQLNDMRAAYNRWAELDTNNPPAHLDMGTATTRLHQLAVSSSGTDLDPDEKVLVSAILHSTIAQSKVTGVDEPFYSLHTSWPITASMVADQIEIYHFSLALLAVAAAIVIDRIVHKFTAAKGLPGHGMAKMN